MMVSKILFLLGMFPAGVIYICFLFVLFNEFRKTPAALGSAMNVACVIAAGSLFFLGALTAHILGW